MITFGQFKNSGNTKRLSGICTDSPDFVSYTNGAVSQLLRRGQWFGTLRSVRACIYDGCVTWPRQVATIMAINTCGYPSPLYNRWFSFLPMQDCARFYGAWRLGGFQRGLFTESIGTSPVFNPIGCGKDMYLRFYISNPTDNGKTITILGIDSNGQVIRTQRNDGTIQEGMTLTLKTNGVQTPIKFRHVTRVVKSETNYVVRGYQYDDATNAMTDLCSYEPSEICPEYVQTRIAARRSSHQGCCAEQVEALVKIKFVPVKYDDDLLLIDNETAMANMVMSVRFKEMGDIPNARAYEAEAFRELNYQMKDLFPDEQFVVNFRPFGNDNLNDRNIRIGQI